ncbi:proteasome 20S subunit beta 7 [Phyllostomus discolor]|uniref:Proteasome 20S subunit beta 7 n=1 Tax=Phyllostomus discolor TaxID=89673 RepID=A0A834BAK4_9CHIR|nr:proteasome 20S subunit beta 7 [Phyllostomus discolor]
MTWALEVTLTSVSSARASWIFSVRTQCPTRRGPGLASTGVRKGPLRSSLKKSLPWKSRCWRKRSRRWTLPERSRGIAGHGSGRRGAVGVPL